MGATRCLYFADGHSKFMECPNAKSYMCILSISGSEFQVRLQEVTKVQKGKSRQRPVEMQDTGTQTPAASTVGLWNALTLKAIWCILKTSGSKFQILL